MKLSVILVSFLVAFISLNQSFAEVYTTGSAADNNGNIIVIGYCLGNVAIGGEQFNITTPSAFILKLNSDGEKIWVRFINSSQSIKANAVAVDSSGNIYITGEFSGTANFDSYSLTAQRVDAYIVKYNSQGNADWVKHGTYTLAGRGSDIYASRNGNIHLCGYGMGSITFDTLTASRGFALTIDSLGNITKLFSTTIEPFDISVDNEDNLIFSGTLWINYPPYGYEQIVKYDNNGNLIWSNNISQGHTITDNNLFIYSSRYLNKYDTNGNYISGINDFSNCLDIKIHTDTNVLIAGSHSNAKPFFYPLISNGMTDSYIAKTDTGFNLLWVKHGGGLYDDELNSVISFLDGAVLATGNFRDSINFDSVRVVGGMGLDDNWVGILKLDNEGNLQWFNKIAENFLVSSPINWCPLNSGNKWNHYGYRVSLPQSSVTIISKTVEVVDSTYLDDKLYYKMNGFFGFSNNTLIKYDTLSQRIIISKGGIDYTFLDFSKSIGEVYQQIQPNGSFNDIKNISGSIVVLSDTLITRGFLRNTPMISGTYNFAENIGFVSQDEINRVNYGSYEDIFLIEYKIYNPSLFHDKHEYLATINFDNISFVPETNRIVQNFQILHHLSVLTNNLLGFSYIKNAYLESFYYNGADTIWNNNFNIPQTTEIDFSLNYQFDTTKYNQGYHLYYRIAAVDKGIVADTFYSPQTGYYKLFWKDSTTSVTQTEFEALTYSLSQNYPNPFNPVSKIVFTIPKRENVSLKVYDILGSEITTLVNKELDAGKYEVDFSGKDLSSGIYIYQIKAGAFRETKKMILMR